uniref:Uncharacterized protein n=1 Tax=Phytophthora fragariae TaxID=53985 RepID=A0A6A3F0V8_9STRA|nr:hypothetical protein PF009_g14195 [Phytophthora fragariae]
MYPPDDTCHNKPHSVYSFRATMDTDDTLFLTMFTDLDCTGKDEGVWNPVHKKLLLCTLMTDWEAAAKTPWTTEDATMRQEALMSANVSCDESVRAWTQRENEILLAYLRGRLDLPHPPNFIKEILIGEHRAMFEDMHEAYLNATLTAVLLLVLLPKDALLLHVLLLARADARGEAAVLAQQLVPLLEFAHGSG